LESNSPEDHARVQQATDRELTRALINDGDKAMSFAKGFRAPLLVAASVTDPAVDRVVLYAVQPLWRVPRSNGESSSSERHGDRITATADT